MGISGSLKDVSVADVMQFIHLGRRTGTLLLARGSQRAMVGFHGGRLVSAQAPHTPKLGDLLVSSGLIDRGILDQAIQTQGQEREQRRSLGQLLLASGAIDAEGLRQVIAKQIEQAVSEVMVWETGTFEFAIDDLRPIDDIALYPSDVLPDADINTQMVLLEAARIFDERNRDGAHADATRGGGYAAGDSTNPTLEPRITIPPPTLVLPEPREDLSASRFEAPKHAAERLQLQLVSADRALAEVLGEALRQEVASVALVPIGQAGAGAAGDPPPIVLLDLRSGGLTLDKVAALRRSRPRASLIALVDPGTPVARVYEAGVLNAIPAEIETLVACVENLIESRSDLVRGSAGDMRGEVLTGGTGLPQSGVARLRRVFGDLRSGLISATVALNLMHIISESVERAVLFLVKRDHLVALGAFGIDAEGRPLAERTRGLKLDIHADSVFTRSLEMSEVQSLTFEEADLPEPFRTLVGRSRTGQVVVFPVLGAQRVISVIYTDNGESEEPIGDIDILELATAQVGMAFENELLRRQISQTHE